VAGLDALLALHQPILRYDRHEVYFAGSAAIWTDCPGNVLKRFPTAVVIAEPPALRLSFLGPTAYGDGTGVQREDLIACPTKNYAELARVMHGRPGMADRAYGRAAEGSDGRIWLQYWFFYFYNDYELLGDGFPAGLHEGDWEMVQLRLDAPAATPELAVYAQHKGGEALWWEDVQKVDGQPVLYVARGSHAAYFSAGRHWHGHWWDHADGKGFSPSLTLETVHDDDPAYGWMRWPGLWGDTKPNPDEIFKSFDATSPRGPGGHAQWRDPHRLLEAVEGHEAYEVDVARETAGVASNVPSPAPAAPVGPPAPAVAAARTPEGSLELTYDASGWPADLTPRRLIVTANAPDEPTPPVARSVEVEGRAGSVVVPVEVDPALRYEIHTSLAGVPATAPETPAPPLTSEATSTGLPARG
jgi:hypothetical protein